MAKKKIPDERLKGLAAKAETQPPPEQHPIAKMDTAPTMGKAGLVLHTLDQMETMAQHILASGWAPRDMNSSAKILVAMQSGFEVGLPMMQSVQNIAVINGRPTLWGDALLALVEASGKLASRTQKLEGTGDDLTATYTTIRKGRQDPVVWTFSVADAKKANLWGKAGSWTTHPKRMLLNRARAFCLRDDFPDVLKGLHDREEVMDYIPVDAEVDVGTSGVAALAERIAPKTNPKDKAPPAQDRVFGLDQHLLAQAKSMAGDAGWCEEDFWKNLEIFGFDDSGLQRIVNDLAPVTNADDGTDPLPETVPESVTEELDTMEPKELDDLWQLARKTGGAVTEENFIEGLKRLGPDDMKTKMEVRIEKNVAEKE